MVPGDFADFIRVETEGGSYQVPVIAQREPPQLDIPSVLDMGACLVGDAMRVGITVTNTGGKNTPYYISSYTSIYILSHPYSHTSSFPSSLTLLPSLLTLLYTLLTRHPRARSHVRWMMAFGLCRGYATLTD